MNEVSPMFIRRSADRSGTLISLGLAGFAALLLATSGCDSSSGAAPEGLACTSVADCAGGQLCTKAGACYDGSVGDPCATNADCALLDSQGNHVGCESTGKCAVVDCRDDNDCGSQEVCDTGICYPLYCSGSPTSCSTLQAGNCNVLGCYLSGSCSGYAPPCSGFFTSSDCGSQQGCSWSTLSGGSCMGVSASCSAQSSSGACFAVNGCNWSQSCTGSAASCSTFSASSCTLQPGCFVTH